MDPAPFIPPELVDWLDKMYPERTPDLSASLDMIRFASGQRQVVRFLRHKHEEQVEQAMNPTA